MLVSAIPASTDTILGASFDKYLPLANALALIFISIYTHVVNNKTNKVVAISEETKAATEATTDKLEVVHKLVNNAASEQQKKVDALERELRELRFIFDKMQPPQARS